VSGLTPGLRLMIASAFFFSVMSLMVKLGGQTMPSQMLVFARAAVALIMSYAELRWRGISPRGNHPGPLVARGVLGFFGLTCFYWSVTHLPLSEATVIQHLSPLLTTLLAGLFLRERVGPRELLALCVSLVGVALIARPAFIFGQQAVRHDPVVIAVALLAVVVSSCAYTMVRSLKGKEDPLVVVFYFPLVATPLAVVPAVMVWRWPLWWEWLILIGIGVFTQLAQLCMTRGLHLESAARAMSMNYLQIVFAFGWGILLLHERPDLWALAGTALILSSALVVARRGAALATPAATPGGR
jgi:drug/metabolite transporter (DMT)-like permease